MKKIIFYIVFIQFGVFGQNIGININNPQATLDINGDIINRTGSIIVTNSLINNLDVNSSKKAIYYLDASAPFFNFVIAGIQTGAQDRLVTLINRTGNSCQLYHEYAATPPANRIHTGSLNTLDIYSGGSVQLIYDNSINRWRVIAQHFSSLDYFGQSYMGPTSFSCNQIININNPSEGQTVYNNTTHQFNFYNGSAWKNYDGSLMQNTPNVGSPPVNLSSSGISGQKATLAWDPITDATSYQVSYIKIASGAIENTINTNSPSILISSLDGGSRYNWKAQAIIPCGLSPYSQINSFDTLPMNVIMNLVDFSFFPETTKLAWEAP